MGTIYPIAERPRYFFTEENDPIWCIDVKSKRGALCLLPRYLPGHAAICHQKASISIPGGFQKTHETPPFTLTILPGGGSMAG